MTERQLHRATAQYFAAVLDPNLVLFVHCPNEGKRGRWAQADFKLGGGLPGVPDWMLSWQYPARGPIEETLVAWVELKSPSAPKKLPAAQEAFRERVLGLGHHHAVCRDLEAVAEALHGWGVPMRPHRMLGNGIYRTMRGSVWA